MKKRVLYTVTLIILIFALSLAASFAALAVFINRRVDFSVDEMLFYAAKAPTLTRFYANGAGVGSEYLPVEIESMSMNENVKSFYSLGSFSDCLKEGFIAVEDREFYHHKGVNARRTVMAVFNYLFNKKNGFGASTITQQVIKNISGDNERSPERKLAEMVRALRIEQKHSKDEILELYLNVVPLGERIVGLGTGARHYFGKEPSELTAAESALLIGLANAPGMYNPHANPERCIKKRNTVLGVMYSEGVIDESQYREALESPLGVLEKSEIKGENYSWFVETVIEDISRDYAREYGVSEKIARLLLLGGGYRIYTTESIEVQRYLEEFFADRSNFPSETAQGLDFSMVITDVATSDLLGIVGSVGTKDANLIVNHATAPHTPASTLKPIALYAPLIDDGRICWSTVFDDTPIDFIDGVRPYPANSPNVYDGLVTVKDAICCSKNTVAMRLYDILGAETIYKNLKDNYGIHLIRNDYNSKGERITDMAPAPMALGQLTRGIGLRALTEAYTAFPAEGVLRKGRSYIRIEDGQGNTVIENDPEEKRIYKKETAEIMNQLLMNVTDHGTARKITLGSTVDTAGKTGTSGGNLDKLFVGYTPYLAAGIRAGYNDSKTAVSSIAPSHLEIWDEVMTELHNILWGDEIERPRAFSTDGLIYAPYCKDSGKLFTDVCALDPRGSRVEYGYFIPSSRSTDFCDTHVLVDYDLETEAIAHAECPTENIVKIALLNIPSRSFPSEVIISDAEYVYRKVAPDIPRGDSFDVPYYIYTIPEGEYVGRSAKKKQFNHHCYLHD